MKELLVIEKYKDSNLLIDKDKALESFSEALKHDPKYAKALANRMLLYNSKEEYDLNICVMDVNYEIMVGDVLYIDGSIIRDERVFTFGLLDSEYGRKINNINDKEIVVFKRKDKKYYMKRYYG